GHNPGLVHKVGDAACGVLVSAHHLKAVELGDEDGDPQQHRAAQRDVAPLELFSRDAPVQLRRHRSAPTSGRAVPGSIFLSSGKSSREKTPVSRTCPGSAENMAAVPGPFEVSHTKKPARSPCMVVAAAA